MGKISFKKLHKLVAGIDPIYEDSYPVMFTVAKKGEEHHEGQTYLVGLTDELTGSDGELYDGLCQFIRLLSTGKIIDLQDEELMSFDEIGALLKEKCGIERGCSIYLEKDCSFGGEWYYVDEEDCYDRSWFREQEDFEEKWKSGEIEKELEEELVSHNS